MDDKQKEVVFKKWMRTVHGLEPAFFIRSAPLSRPCTKPDGKNRYVIAIDTLSYLERKKSQFMLLRGMSKEFGDDVTFGFTGISIVLNSVDNRFMQGILTSFEIFMTMLKKCKTYHNAMHMIFPDGSIRKFISPDLSFEEMQVQADLGDING